MSHQQSAEQVIRQMCKAFNAEGLKDGEPFVHPPVE